jgi:hypothetical protein
VYAETAQVYLILWHVIPLKTPFRLLIGFITILQVVTTITYYTSYNQYTLIFSFCSERLVFTWKLPTVNCLGWVWVLCYDDSQSASLSWYKAPIWAYDQIFIPVRNTEYVGQLRVCWYGALSLTRGRVCRLQLLLALASAVILGFESLGTRDHIYCLRSETSFVRHSVRAVTCTETKLTCVEQASFINMFLK